MLIGLTSPAWPGTDTPNGIVTAVTNLRAGLKATGHDGVVISERCEPGSGGVPLTPWRPPNRLRRLANRLRPPNGFVQDHARRVASAAAPLVDERGVAGFLMEETYGWAGLVQPRLSVPVISTLHGPWSLHQPLTGRAPTEADRLRIRLEAEGLRLSAGVAAPSQDVLDRMIDDAELPDAIPRALIPNAIVAGPQLDFASLTGRERRSLLFVGRFDRHKGGDVMLEAFGRLIAGGADAFLTFVGPDRGCDMPGRGRVRLQEALADLPAEARARIEVLGRQPRDAVARLRLRHPIAVVASRYENLNYTLLETLAVGGAAVCTAVGGPMQAVRDGETGLLVPPEDPQAMANACRALLDDPERVRRIGEAARREAVSVYAPEPVARRTVAFVEECAEALARRRRG